MDGPVDKPMLHNVVHFCSGQFPKMLHFCSGVDTAPEWVAQIKVDHQKKIEAAAKKREINPLRPYDGVIDFDEIYGNQKVCLACHK